MDESSMVSNTCINYFYHHREGKQMELTLASKSYLEVMMQPMSHQDPPSDEI